MTSSILISRRRSDYRNSSRRSSSVPKYSNFERSKREPVFDIAPDQDVATHICLEIGKAILICPELNTASLFDTVKLSRRDLNKSDTVIVVTAAVLADVGNMKMNKKLLSKSDTCHRYYIAMGLDKPDVRRMFITMIFALHPSFVAMIQKTLIIAINRSAEVEPDVYTDRQVINSIGQLRALSLVEDDETVSAIDVEVNRAANSIVGTNVSMNSKTEDVTPWDSVSNVGGKSSNRKSFLQTDILEFIKRKKHGVEPEAEQVFPSFKRPVEARPKLDKTGIGYTRKLDHGPIAYSNPTNRINAILGNISVPSVNISTGNVRSRPPKVEDVLDSTSVSTTVLRSPNQVEPVDWTDVNARSYRLPTASIDPQETSLTYEETEPADTAALHKKVSAENILKFLTDKG